MKHTPFKDRAEAGRLLAERLSGYRGREDLVVLALPRGGVPVAFEIARELDGPLDVFLVRKLGVPGREELALGAIASGAIRVLNTQLVDALEITTEQIEAIAARELQELERRERAYRGDRPAPDVSGRTVILVDDGLATGATMSAAVLAVRQDEPASVVMAVPVGDPDVCASFREYADEVVCLRTPQPLRGVGAWYEDFSQTTDDEVRELLARARRPRERRPPPSNLTPLTGAGDDYDGLVQRAASARYALLGEASHGTHDFYVARAEITKRLIVEHGFDIVAVEADWPDAYRVNRFVRGTGDDDNAEEALGDFCRFPVWMWRNTDVAEFVAWLRAHNDALPAGAPKVGFYGLDLYSLYTSIDAVVSYLEEIDPAAAQRARERYACFGHFGRDPQVYAHEAGIGGAEPCERQAVEQLAELRSLAAGAALSNGCLDDDRQFYAEQNARLVVDAEQHYRAVFRGGHESWNLRDRHMVETLEALVADMERRRAGTARAVVWEHNSHVGDARATDMGQAGQLNVGQLVRERHGDDAFIVGFTTYTGTVTAASGWGADAERKHVRRALPGSWEETLHEQGVPAFIIDAAELEGRGLERAIGVVYRPETERLSHYLNARMATQFDAVIHLDETRAVEPLERSSEWERGELPETYPWGV
ncbi:MAG: erythromycin esterase family protein [Actinomycetota bacterium]|nr:erythromycin esterase family protein [Actinomycetota bacterium]